MPVAPHPLVVLTGFEPFLTHPRNPSDEVAHSAARALERLGIDARAITLPVTFACAQRFLSDQITSPEQIVVHIGLAERRAHISLEQRAFNRHGDTPDNLSVIPPQEQGGRLLVCEDAPFELVSGLDLAALQGELSRQLEGQEAMPPVRITQDAGDYVCNAIYYHSLRNHPRALFVHVPHLSAGQADLFGEHLAHAITATWLANASPAITP